MVDLHEQHQTIQTNEVLLVEVFAESAGAFCIQNHDGCIEHDGFCIENHDVCIENDGFLHYK